MGQIQKKSAIQGKSLILIIGVRYIYRGMSSQLLQKMSGSLGYFGQQISCQKKIPDIFWCAVYFRYNSYDFKKQYIFCTLFFLIFSPLCMMTYHSNIFPPWFLSNPICLSWCFCSFWNHFVAYNSMIIHRRLFLGWSMFGGIILLLILWHPNHV